MTNEEKRNIYNNIQNLYNMDFTTWQEVLAQLYNLVADIDQKFDAVKEEFELMLGKEVANKLEEMYNDGSLEKLLNTQTLERIKQELLQIITINKTEFDNFKNEINEQLDNMVRVDIRQFGIVADGTDQTTKIVELFNSEIFNNFEGFIIIPYGVKMNNVTVYNNTPKGVILEDYSLNSYKSSSYRRKHYGYISGGDTVDNDSIFTLQSGHHSVIALNNFKKSLSDSNQKAMNTILFCDGFQSDGTIDSYMRNRTYVKNNKYVWSLAINKLYSLQEKTDSTIAEIDELGKTTLGGNLIVKTNTSHDTSTSSYVEIENKNQGSICGFKATTDNGTFTIRERNGELYCEHNGEIVWSTSGYSFKIREEMLSFKNLTGSELNVDGASNFIISNTSPTTLTSLIGANNKKITLYFKDGNTTLPKTLIKLKGNIDYTPTALSSITLIKTSSLNSLWVEVSRNEM